MIARQLSRAEQKSRTRKRILDAATLVFAEQGFDAASMGGIAARAGVKKALVQYHFETKLKLWQSAMDTLWQGLQELKRDPLDLAALTPEQRSAYLRDSLRAVIRFARANPTWVAILFREASTPGPRLDWLIERHLHEDFALGLDFIRSAQAHGLLPPGSAMHLLHIICGALTYPLLVAPLTRRATGVEMSDEQSLDTIVDLLLGQLSF